MPLSAYQRALADLTDHARQAVEEVFTAGLTGSTHCQVSRNVADETALSTADFTSLLEVFAAQLASGDLPRSAWQTACRAHKRKGRVIPATDCPATLGRAKGLDHHAAAIARASHGDLTKEQAKKLLFKYSGSVDPDGFETFLREALLGDYLVWATFNPVDTGVNPFDRLPRTQHGICTALGLGSYTSSNTLVILAWSHADSGSPPLHRPTVADAEDYPYYRPRPEADAPWGLTEPLSPNPDKLEPQPEVVMPETTSRGLRLPFHVIQA